MKKPYVPRPAGRHIVDSKTGALKRSGPFTDPDAKPTEAIAAAIEKSAAPPAAAKPAEDDGADKKGK